MSEPLPVTVVLYTSGRMYIKPWRGNVSTTRTLVDIDDSLLARAAAKLGTSTKKDTVNRALELAAADDEADRQARQRFGEFARRSAARMAEVDWDQAWH